MSFQDILLRIPEMTGVIHKQAPLSVCSSTLRIKALKCGTFYWKLFENILSNVFQLYYNVSDCLFIACRSKRKYKWLVRALRICVPLRSNPSVVITMQFLCIGMFVFVHVLLTFMLFTYAYVGVGVSVNVSVNPYGYGRDMLQCVQWVSVCVLIAAWPLLFTKTTIVPAHSWHW